MSAIKVMAMGRKITAIYAGLSKPICKKYGINQSCFDVLMFCANNPDYNTARDICSVRGIKSGIASVAVENLIQAGLMVRIPDLSDRRIHRLVPTDKAKKIILEGRKMQNKFIFSLKNGITPEEEAVFERVNEKILENINRLSMEEV